ncbi:MAG: cytochrome c maturation protein CcmE [Acidobacteriota bacterium]
MKLSPVQIIGGVLVVAFAAFTLTSFSESLTPYVSYDEARTLKRTVQVAGELLDASSRYESEDASLYFTLKDPEGDETLPVRYQGVKPANFEEAISIVAIGRFDSEEKILVADELLVKCPSKYQGAEVEQKSYS